MTSKGEITEKTLRGSLSVSSLELKQAEIGPDGTKIVEGSEGVTEHEFRTLRHVADRLPLAAWLVAIVEFAERYTQLFLSLNRC